MALDNVLIALNLRVVDASVHSDYCRRRPTGAVSHDGAQPGAAPTAREQVESESAVHTTPLPLLVFLTFPLTVYFYPDPSILKELRISDMDLNGRHMEATWLSNDFRHSSAASAIPAFHPLPPSLTPAFPF